jgi:hypothetical protein
MKSIISMCPFTCIIPRPLQRVIHQTTEVQQKLK